MRPCSRHIASRTHENRSPQLGTAPALPHGSRLLLAFDGFPARRRRSAPFADPQSGRKIAAVYPGNQNRPAMDFSPLFFRPSGTLSSLPCKSPVCCAYLASLVLPPGRTVIVSARFLVVKHYGGCGRQGLGRLADRGIALLTLLKRLWQTV
jgi:hypothetical protein